MGEEEIFHVSFFFFAIPSIASMTAFLDGVESASSKNKKSSRNAVSLFLHHLPSFFFRSGLFLEVHFRCSVLGLLGHRHYQLLEHGRESGWKRKQGKNQLLFSMWAIGMQNVKQDRMNRILIFRTIAERMDNDGLAVMRWMQ